MKTIVFLMGGYYPSDTANINCCSNVIELLKKNDYKVIVICGDEKSQKISYIEGIEVHRVIRKEFAVKYQQAKSELLKKFLMLKRIVHNIISLPFFPNTELRFTYRMYRELLEVAKRNNIEAVIGNYRPSSSLGVILRIKKNKTINNIKTIGYYLDLLHVSPKPALVPLWYYKKLCLKADIKAFNSMDAVILPEGGKEYYSSSVFERYKNKMYYTNFPVFFINQESYMKNIYGNTFVYAGFSNLSDRDPGLFIKLLEEVSKKQDFNYSLNMYGRTESITRMREYEQAYKGRFIYNGLVEKKMADKKLLEADFLIAFGNVEAGSIPSKIFELFGTKKRIIYIASNHNDSALKYVKLYPKACIIYRGDSLKESLDNLIGFINEKEFDISNDYLLDCYYSATPEAVYKVVERIVSE